MMITQTMLMIIVMSNEMLLWSISGHLKKSSFCCASRYSVLCTCLHFLLRGERRVITPFHLPEKVAGNGTVGVLFFVCMQKIIFLYAYGCMYIIKKVNEFIFRRISSSPGQYITFSSTICI